MQRKICQWGDVSIHNKYYQYLDLCFCQGSGYLTVWGIGRIEDVSIENQWLGINCSANLCKLETNLELIQIENMSEEKYKNILKTKVEALAFKYLI